MKKKLAIKSFNFFYGRLQKDVIEFEKVVGKKVVSLRSGKRQVDTEEEFSIYRNICLLYNRLASEYQEIIFICEGEIPKSMKSKIEKIYLIGEMISTFQAIRKSNDGYDGYDGYGYPDE